MYSPLFKYPVLIGLTSLLLVGCEHAPTDDPEVRQIIAERGVDKITQVSDDHYNIYCPTGICQFDVKNQGPSHIKFSFYYAKDKPFTKLEGVNVDNLGSDKEAREFIDIKNNQTSIMYHATIGNHYVRVQVIDYYR